MYRLRCYFTVIHSVRHQNAITCAPSSWVLTLAPVVCRDGAIDAGTRVCCVDQAIARSLYTVTIVTWLKNLKSEMNEAGLGWWCDSVSVLITNQFWPRVCWHLAISCCWSD